AVLPVATEVLACGARHALPRALDIVRAARAVDGADRRPDWMIAAENEAVAGAAANRVHSAPICVDACCRRIMKPAAVDRAPEIRVELEIATTPLAPHRPEQLLEMLLHRGMRAVEDVPRTAPPPAERDAVGAKRRPIGVFDEPVAVLLKHLRRLFGDERRHPDRRLEPAFADLGEDALHVAAERRAGFEPVAHGGLIAIVDLNVGEARHVVLDRREIVEHLLRCDARSEAVP